MTEAKNPWLEERHFRRDAIRGSRKLLEAILTAHGVPFQRKRKRIYRPRQQGFEVNATCLRVQREVATHFGLRPDLLYLSGRSRWYARPRQIAMYLAHTVGGVSLPRIGRHFNRDHTTVLHACRAVAANDKLSADVEVLIEALSPAPVKTGDIAALTLRMNQEQAIEHSGNTQEERWAA